MIIDWHTLNREPSLPVILRRIAACVYSPGRLGSRLSVCQSVIILKPPERFARRHAVPGR